MKAAMTFAIALHVLAVALWVGGMAFALFVLRPALAPLAPPQRLGVLSLAFRRFLAIVGAAVVVVVASGAWLVVRFGGFAHLPPGTHVMIGCGVLMIALYLHLAFALEPRLRRAVEATDLSVAAAAAGTIRHLVMANLALGVVAIVAAIVAGPR